MEFSVLRPLNFQDCLNQLGYFLLLSIYLAYPSANSNSLPAKEIFLYLPTMGLVVLLREKNISTGATETNP